MTVTREAIARAALGVLNETGLDGLTMRLVAADLGVRAPTLYWHVKNKQELLDAMANLIVGDSNIDLQAPGRDQPWADWVVELARRMRATMLGYRDGARVLAGSYTTHPSVATTIEMTLRTLCDAGIPVREAARAFPVVLHYTVGFTIEEQARSGAAYGKDNPYETDDFLGRFPPERFPLLSSVRELLFDLDTDAAFEHGLRLILAGLQQLTTRS